MIPLLYQGSVKDVRGPVTAQVSAGENSLTASKNSHAIVFDYSDAYSVFDWGRMPDVLKHKGEALAIIAADWFEKLEQSSTWKDFSKSQTALNLRKGNKFGSAFIEMGERLQHEGIRTHYLGVVAKSDEHSVVAEPTSRVDSPFKQVAVQPVAVVKPKVAQILGRSVSDYSETRVSPSPRLIPLEVVFRFSCPPGSSLLERVSRDPQYLTSIGYPGLNAIGGERWDFPVLEIFTKLESTDRLLTLSEGLAISGLTAEQLQEVLFKTAWVAGWVKSVCEKKGLELADGKLEWAIDERGQLILVDAIGPDELRILSPSKTGASVQLSKEFLREYYRKTPWYERINLAKKEAASRGIADWKRGVGEGPLELTPQFRELASQLYQSLANELTGRTWFVGAWPLTKVTEALHAEVQGAGKGSATGAAGSAHSSAAKGHS